GLGAGRASLRAESLGVVVRPLALTPNDVVEIAELLEPVADLSEEDSYEELDFTRYAAPLVPVDEPDAVDDPPLALATVEHSVDLTDGSLVPDATAIEDSADGAGSTIEPLASNELDVRILGP